jgi:sulfite reductase alpha subunit-like flavoprotein
VELEISLGSSGIQYSPGDSIGICAPNPRDLVEATLHRLQAKHTEEPGLSLSSLVSVGSGVGGGAEAVTLEELLSYRLDLVGPPRKSSVAALSAMCEDEKDRAGLLWLVSKCEVGKALWAKFVEGQGLGLGELLLLFPSCKPSLEALAAAAGSLLPRYYSLASSPLATGHKVSLAFSIEHYCCGQDGFIRRAGLCTSYLESVLAPWLYPALAPGLSKAATSASASGSAKDPPGVFVRLFPRPTVAFRLPGSVAPPLLLVGPGTGVSPFVGFLQHRQALERERRRGSGSDESCSGTWRGGFELDQDDLPGERNQVDAYIHSVAPGPVILYFGCRDESDWLYREQMQAFLKDGTLSEYHVATSRTQQEKVYVTHKLKEHGEAVARLLLKDGGSVYVCGDGNAMAKDVYCTVRACLVAHGGLNDAQAEEFLTELKARRRYVLEIWS